MSAQRLSYASDLTDEEWQILEPILPPEQPGGRPRKYPMREVINGIQYVLRGVRYLIYQNRLAAYRMGPRRLRVTREALEAFRRTILQAV